MKIAMVGLACALTFSSPVHADDLSFRLIQSACSNPNPVGVDHMLCIGYVTGFAVGYGMASGDLDPGRKLICFPNRTIPHQELVSVVLAFAKNNPQRLDDTASSAVLRALSEGFPCPFMLPQERQIK